MSINNSKPFLGGTVFPNTGGSHVTIGGNTGTHITSEIGGLKQGGQVGIHIPVSNTGKIGNPNPFFKK